MTEVSPKELKQQKLLRLGRIYWAIQIVVSVPVFWLMQDPWLYMVLGMAVSTGWQAWSAWSLLKNPGESYIEAKVRHIFELWIEYRHGDKVIKVTDDIMDTYHHRHMGREVLHLIFIFLQIASWIRDTILWPGEIAREVLKWPFPSLREPFDERRK